MADQSSKTQKVKDEIRKEVEKIPPTSDQNLMAALSYAWVLSLVMLILKRKDDYIQFHAKQGVILWIGSLLAIIPGLGWIIWALSIAGMVVGFINAWQGKRSQLPIVYNLSRKINF